MAILLPNGKQAFSGVLGLPLVGGRVYTYAAGTNTPKTTWVDANETVPNTNPVILDARGEASIFWNGAYKVLLCDALYNIIWTQDNVTTIDPIVSEFATFKAALAAATTPALLGFRQDGIGAVLRTMLAKARETVSVLDFGAVGDGIADDTDAIQKAITFCQLMRRALYLPPGTYKVTDTLEIVGINNDPMTLTGDRNAPMQQGSLGPSAIIRWEGGAKPVFHLGVSGSTIEGFAVQNFGTATDAFEVDAGQHYYFRRLSFLPLNASTRFSRSIFHMVNATMGYGRWETMWFASSAPKFIFIDGGTGGGTPMDIYGRGIFESNSLGSTRLVYIRDMDIDEINIYGNTFNQQENFELRIFECNDTPRSVVTTNFVFENNEIDIVSNNVNDRMLAFNNCENIKIDGNSIQGGAVGAIGRLINSHITSFDSNYVRSVGSVGLGVFDLDSASTCIAGSNRFTLTTMSAGIFNDNAFSAGVIPLAISAGNVLINLANSLPTGNGAYRIDMAANVAANFVVSQMTDSTRGMPTKGQEFTLQIKNTSGVTLTLLTPQSNFKLEAGALAGIANGTTRCLRLLYDGTNVQQLAPFVDIPN